MGRIDPNTLSPVARAQYDFREEGLGQDSNPFDRATQHEQWEAYAWEMHRLWAEDFAAEQQAGKAIEKQMQAEK